MFESLVRIIGLGHLSRLPRYDRLLVEYSQYRRFLTATLITGAGDGLHLMASMWLVHSLTGSTALTGTAAFLARAPRVFNFLMGPFVDKWSTNRALFRTQVVQGFTVLVIPVAAYAGYLTVELVLVTIPITALFNTFEGPAISSAPPKLVTDEDITTANSIESVLHHGMDLVLKPVGGFVIAAFGAVVLFGVNAVSFYLASVFFLFLRFPEATSEEDRTDEGPTGSVGERLRDHYDEIAEGFRHVRTTFLLNVVVSITAAQVAIGATRAVAPMYSDSRGGPVFYGLLLTAISVGTLLGNVLASALDQYAVGRLIAAVSVLGTVFWVAAINFPLPRVTIGLFVLATVPLGFVSTLSLSLVHTVVQNDLMGRVIATITTLTGVATPVGALGGGFLAEYLGARTTFTLAATGYVVLLLFFTLDRRLRTLPPVEQAEV